MRYFLTIIIFISDSIVQILLTTLIILGSYQISTFLTSDYLSLKSLRKFIANIIFSYDAPIDYQQYYNHSSNCMI